MHFKAKDKQYLNILTAIKSNKSKSYFLSKCKEFLNKIKVENLDQKQFQEYMGCLECWGECYVKLFN